MSSARMSLKLNPNGQLSLLSRSRVFAHRLFFAEVVHIRPDNHYSLTFCYHFERWATVSFIILHAFFIIVDDTSK
jgi:hypothetical protein